MASEFKGTPGRCLTLEDAAILCKETDYLTNCCDDYEDNPINWDDAAAFFLEGVLHERKASTHLIAAAPELLEAMKAMVGTWESSIIKHIPALQFHSEYLKSKEIINKALNKMTFATSCFVRVEDPERRKELIKWLKEIGYLLNATHDDEAEFVVAMNDAQLEIDGVCACLNNPIFLGSSRAIGCSNIELFKALAAMNDKNDYQQWFRKEMTNGSTDWYDCPIISIGTAEGYRKATASEIIEHFKK